MHVLAAGGEPVRVAAHDRHAGRCSASASSRARPRSGSAARSTRSPIERTSATPEPRSPSRLSTTSIHALSPWLTPGPPMPSSTRSSPHRRTETTTSPALTSMPTAALRPSTTPLPRSPVRPIVPHRAARTATTFEHPP
ncbi:hypothetical protein CNX65_21155 [Actinosynnema pretiosum]|uniref:Uncharacterized protein n=1 Tax=Actinosynnema pretiosum TaxID=42197 RepID=A0A290Z935_9PSEU|nr:hypothetical protein CNX65_21155 [Actinosynnema pretiosum]